MAECLQSAILSGDVELVSSSLLSGVFHVNKILPDGRTPLNAAIAHGSDAVIDVLIEAGADLTKADSFRVDSARLRPIHYAARHGRLDLVWDLLSYVDVDDPDDGNCTPLHHAATMGHINMVQVLLDAGADVNWQSNSGRTPLWKAAAGGHRDTLLALTERGAVVNVDNRVGETVLFEVVKDARLAATAADLLRMGVDVHWRDIEGNVVLHKACALGNLALIEMLLQGTWEGKEHVSTAVNDYGNTALHNAAMFGHVDCVTALLNHGVCVTLLNRVNKAGQGALSVAMVQLQGATCRLLHDAGARLSAKERHHYELHEATRSDSKRAFWEDCIRYFREPKTLTTLCVVAVRRHLRQPIALHTDSLPLPRALQKLVLLQE